MDNSTSKCPFGFGAAAPSDSADRTEAAPVIRHMGMPPAMKRTLLPELLTQPIEPGQDGQVTGRCLCGKVSFAFRRPVSMVFASHDAVSRRRSGGVALTIMIRATNTAFSGWGHLVNYPVSDHEISCFCRVCGAPVLVRHVMPPAMEGMISISAGLLDSTEGLTLAADLSHDEKPAYYAFAGERRVFTASEITQMLAAR